MTAQELHDTIDAELSLIATDLQLNRSSTDDRLRRFMLCRALDRARAVNCALQELERREAGVLAPKIGE